MFGIHLSTACGDITHLICHVTSRDNVIEGSYDFMGGSLSWKVTTLPSLVAISIVKAFCVTRKRQKPKMAMSKYFAKFNPLPRSFEKKIDFDQKYKKNQNVTELPVLNDVECEQSPTRKRKKLCHCLFFFSSFSSVEVFCQSVIIRY